MSIKQTVRDHTERQHPRVSATASALSNDEHIKSIAGKAVAAAAAASPGGPVAALVAGATAGGLEAVERLSGAALVDLLRNPSDRRLSEEWTRGEAAELGREKERLAANIDRIYGAAQDAADTTNNILALFLQWRRARAKTADPRKARILMAAFVNAFDPEAYSDGLNATLLEVIGSLDYGDLFYLRSLLPEGHGIDPTVAPRFDPSHPPPGSNAPQQLGGPAPSTLAAWHADRLLDARLVWTHRSKDGSYNAFRMTRTTIGERLLKLIGENAFREAETL